MPMRQDCKHYESRTYPTGDTVRKCDLDLAPEAPWRCPTECARYEKRLADVNWTHGTLVTPPTPDEPLDALDRGDGAVAAVLDEAEDHLNAVGARIMAELEAEQARRPGRLKRLFRRKR
ncbi:MAG TPA: hypothetical protein VK007_10010 [Acidimicrobiales bacterium]|nr:hypothetical protein [Acidimicrobiales bacterium]